jgi:ATP-dependent DNA helicase DinG
MLIKSMTDPAPIPPPLPDTIPLPAIAALYLDAQNAHILTDEGELQTLPHAAARQALRHKHVMVCHAPFCRDRLDLEEFYAFDLLELFAFVHPGRFCVPTPHGLCNALGIEPPSSAEDIPFTLMDATTALLKDLQDDPFKAKAEPIAIANVMGLNGKGWPWTPFIFAALGHTYDPAAPIVGKSALAVWKNLPEWAEEAPPPPPSHHGVTPDEAQERLQKLLGFNAETRQAQMDYAANIAATFDPLEDAADPKIVLAEAGTGVGKTLGYLAPASVWAEKNQATVWISTYTKNLQRQIDQELDRLYTNPDIKNAHVATRKGRENYLCLLNLEETASSAHLAKHPTTAIAAGIMARWSAASKDGDLTGADYPGWLSGLLGYEHTSGLADKRGECIYSACDHYKKCFVEHSVRKASRARIVVANHALAMINAAISAPGEDMPSRYIFDEGHHLFDAADSAFAAHLTARETRDFRRWILGAEGGRRSSRARGLKRRAEDLAEGMADAQASLRDIVLAAECLPLDGWTRRLKDQSPSGPTEAFLHEIYTQTHARAEGRNGPYSLETGTQPVNDGVLKSARKLKHALTELQKPMQQLARIFHKKLNDDDGHMDGDTRRRLEAVATSIERRSTLTLQSWVLMLEQLDKGEIIPEFVDWMEIERSDGRAVDVGLYRHHIDPMQPFAHSIRPHLHGMAVTSATLRDSDHEGEAPCETARQRTGAKYLTNNDINLHYDSPFDYANRTKVFIINDVSKNDSAQLAGAYRALFRASGGSALGLFTAISRLRAVHGHIANDLESSGIPLYAQHVNDIDTGTLVDMFRDDVKSCLLGTDAIRDGVDVPGKSLQLIAFDRVPWPRPTILHKARRDAFGGRQYDEMLTRLKLKQAFGRLIRRADDKGVFVMLDGMLPSRLHNAFPKDVEIVKCSLSEAVSSIETFLKAE